MQISIVVPSYNESAVLPELYRRLTTACASCCCEYEIIFVDDGSSDSTWSDILALSREDRRVNGIRLSRNHGHQLALTAGLARARGERILIIDADLQDPPELLAEMMRLMDEGADVVYGKRRRRHGESGFKRFTAYLFYRLLALLSDIAIPADTGDFRLINRRMLGVFNAMPERERFIR